MNSIFSVEGQLLVKHSWSLAVCLHSLSKVTLVNLGEKGNACHTLYFSLPFHLRADIPEKKKKKIWVLHCIWFKLFRTAAVSCALCLILRFNILNPLAFKFIMFYIYQMMQMSMYFPLSDSKLILKLYQSQVNLSYSFESQRTQRREYSKQEEEVWEVHQCMEGSSNDKNI